MDLKDLIETVDNLPPEDFERLKAHIAERSESELRPGETWLAKLDAALDKFWTGVSPDEQAAILQAIQTKSAPSEKGL